MGQAAVDLPDPLDVQPQQEPNTPGGVDDLLAQLAGDEIDRLLAEAESSAAAVAPPPAPTAEAPAPSPQPPPAPAPVPNSDAVTAGNAARELDESIAAALDAATAVAPDDTTAESSGAGEASQLFPPGAVDKVLAEHATAAAPSSSASGAGPSADAVGAIPTAPTASDAGTSAAERSALTEAGSDAAVASGGPDLSVATGDADAPLPIYLKPLAWINAPLDAAPEWVRDGIGKFAIITTVNAVAVLTYVMFFR